jgi:hypothetical protein
MRQRTRRFSFCSARPLSKLPMRQRTNPRHTGFLCHISKLPMRQRTDYKILPSQLQQGLRPLSSIFTIRELKGCNHLISIIFLKNVKIWVKIRVRYFWR